MREALDSFHCCQEMRRTLANFTVTGWDRGGTTRKSSLPTLEIFPAMEVPSSTTTLTLTSFRKASPTYPFTSCGLLESHVTAPVELDCDLATGTVIDNRAR